MGEGAKSKMQPATSPAMCTQQKPQGKDCAVWKERRGGGTSCRVMGPGACHGTTLGLLAHKSDIQNTRRLHPPITNSIRDTIQKLLSLTIWGVPKMGLQVPKSKFRDHFSIQITPQNPQLRHHKKWFLPFCPPTYSLLTSAWVDVSIKLILDNSS